MEKKPTAHFDILSALTSLFIAILMTGYLLSFPFAGYEGMASFKFGFFLLLCAGYAVLILLAGAQLTLIGARPFASIGNRLKRIRPAELLLLLFLLFSLISSVLSNHGGTFFGVFRFEGFFSILLYVLCCLFVSKFFVPKGWMLFLFGASLSLFCALSLIQLLGRNPFGLYPAGYNYYDAGVYYSGEYLGTIGNTGLCAAFLCIAAGILSMSLIVSGTKRKWLLALPLSLAVFTLLETRVDAGLVGFVGGGVLMLPVAVSGRDRLVPALLTYGTAVAASSVSLAVVFHDGWISWEMTPLVGAALTLALLLFGAAAFCAKRVAVTRLTDKTIRRGAVIVTGLAILLPLIALWFYRGPDHGLLYEVSEALHGRLDDSFGTQRVFIWREVLAGVPNRLLFGTGPDTLGYWGIPPFERYNETLGRVVTSGIDAAHNEYLNILACQGLLALLSYLGALLCAAVQWYRTPRDRLSAIAGAGVLFYCLQAFFGISMCMTAPYFWVSLAVLLYAQGTHKKEEVPK